MFRFKIIHNNYTITSSRFKTYEKCDVELGKIVNKLDSLGCLIEEFIFGIGWVIREDDGTN